MGIVRARDDSCNNALDRGHGRPPQLTALAGALDLVPPGPREVRITLVEPPAREPEGGTG